MAEVAAARPSSTVVLARDATDAPEYLLVRRHARAAFGSAFAFPGGVLEPCDTAARPRCSGLGQDEADRLLDVRADGLDYFSAAVRELFEETGVLLADCKAGANALERCRQSLNAGELGWQDFVDEHGIDIHCDRLRYFSHWITPDAAPRRYSTRFFAARLPAGQRACHDGVELTDSRWLTAAAALEAAAGGDIALPFPTRHTLEAIRGLANVDALLAWADDRVRAGVASIKPVLPQGDPRAEPVIAGQRRS